MFFSLCYRALRWIPQLAVLAFGRTSSKTWKSSCFGTNLRSSDDEAASRLLSRSWARLSDDLS